MSSIIKVKNIVAVNFFDLSPHFSFGNHSHEDWEFIYVDNGSFEYEYGGIKYKLSSGEIVFHPPGALHKTVCDGVHSASFFNMIISSKSHSMKFFKRGAFKVPASSIPILRTLMNEAEKTYQVSEPPLKIRPDAPDDGVQTVINLTELFLLSLRRQIRNASTSPYDYKNSVCPLSSKEISDYLKEHINKKVTLDDLSSHFHFGKTCLCEQFKKNTGKSIMDYFIDLKIAKAKVLLRETDYAIQGISDFLGFDSAEYFSRLFKNRVGISPREFRKTLISGTKVKRT